MLVYILFIISFSGDTSQLVFKDSRQCTTALQYVNSVTYSKRPFALDAYCKTIHLKQTI